MSLFSGWETNICSCVPFSSRFSPHQSTAVSYRVALTVIHPFLILTSGERFHTRGCGGCTCFINTCHCTSVRVNQLLLLKALLSVSWLVEES